MQYNKQEISEAIKNTIGRMVSNKIKYIRQAMSCGVE